MKKIFLFAAVAAMLTACSSEELSGNQEAIKQGEPTPVAFSIYSSRATTRAGIAKEINNTNIKDPAADAGKQGFGVFGYYTDGSTYLTANTFPNFMYNQQVKYVSSEWKYEPVKYWPNEYGNAATSDDVDRVSFFSYAPWVKVNPSTGIPYQGDGVTPVGENEKNIVALTRNSAEGDPIIKYIVDTNPTTSVDLLWGVAASAYSTTWGTATSNVAVGMPFIDLVKATTDQKISFNLRHALAKLMVTIDFIDDAATPAGPAANTLNPAETRIYVREVKIGGFVMQGALNLNNKTANEPYWMSYNGNTEMEYEAITFKDGRRDGKEGASDGANDTEKWLGLNAAIIENTGSGAWPTGKTSGVTATTVNLFEGGTASGTDIDPIYVIPAKKDVDVEIIYDVETINPKLAGKLSDGLTAGKSVENKIKHANVFGAVMEAGKTYTLKLHLGMTSVKVDADVTGWTTDSGNPWMPANQ